MAESVRMVQSSFFSTKGLEKTRQFQAWREGHAALFDRFDTPLRPEDGYRGEAVVCRLGDMAIARGRFDPHACERSAAKAAADGVDYHFVSAWLTGGYVGRTARGELRVEAGDVAIIDFAQPISLELAASEILLAIIPRTLLQSIFPAVDDFHGVVVPRRTVAAQLLGDFMRSLHQRARTLEDADVELAIAATGMMLRICLREAVEGRARLPGADVGLLERLRAQIETELSSSALSPDRLAAAAGVSRTQLYRLFEPYGGVARYVQSRRLHRSFLGLIDPLQSERQVSAIAFDCGFSSEAHFSRTFRQAFGMTPSDARRFARSSLAQEAPSEPRSFDANDHYRRWLEQVGR
jgi:AraC-like DNA-binding protein